MDKKIVEIPELEQRMKELDKRINDTFNSLMLDGVEYSTIDLALKPLQNQYNEVYRIYRTMLPYPVELNVYDNKNGELFSIEEFIDYCESGAFIDYDGTGYYATETLKSYIEICPSDIKRGIYRKDFTHVVWYNR